MMRAMWERRRRGQAAIELALVAPVLIALSLGIFDLGRFVAQQSVVTGMAYAGLQTANASASSDVAAAIRSESEGRTVSPTAWGNGNASGTAACQTGETCGDSNSNNPCAAGSAWWSVAGTTACYSMGTCTLSGSTCTVSNWGLAYASRPIAGTSDVLVIKVVLKFTPITPFVSSVAGSVFYVSSTQEQSQTY